MLKAIKREMKGGLPMLWLALGISWGLALVLEVTVNSISAASGFQNDGWLSIGGVVALGAAGLVFFVGGVVQFSSSFHLAITMGCTRRTYLLSAFVANVVLALAAVGACAVVEQGAIVNMGAIADHDCVVGACAHLAPGAIVKAGNTVPAQMKIESGTVLERGAAFLPLGGQHV